MSVLQCEKCKAVATGHDAHVGRKHQACDGRKKGGGSPRKTSGTWQKKGA